MFNRRSLILGVGSVAISTEVLAQKNLPDQSGVYETLAKPVPNDHARVVEFISYTCPACQKYHTSLRSWGDSLPKSLTFEVVPLPLTQSTEELKLLLHRAAISWSQPDKVKSFDNLILEGLSINGNAPNQKVLFDAIKHSGVNYENLKKIPEDKMVSTMMYWRDKAVNYKVKSTPTIGIGGRYTTSPDAVPGREDVFPVILNGLVSRIA